VYQQMDSLGGAEGRVRESPGRLKTGKPRKELRDTIKSDGS
jgi:hypothetical protein